MMAITKIREPLTARTGIRLLSCHNRSKDNMIFGEPHCRSFSRLDAGQSNDCPERLGERDSGSGKHPSGPKTGCPIERLAARFVIEITGTFASAWRPISMH